jgi:hypothetical protein
MLEPYMIGCRNRETYEFSCVFSFSVLGLFGGAIANKTGVRFGEVECGYVAPFAHAVKPAWLVTPSQLNPLPAFVSLQMEHIRD